MRQSLYRSSVDELSLIVFNDYGLYQQRHEKSFIMYLYTIYQFTNAQLVELKSDLLADKLEMAQFETKGV